ncbi:MAG: phospho-N-acetylmuramoyl-pentapeptide-transferase [Chloroflexota bacterium]|jgi:phospho-N-acetylmuramoyl-pentapeptide-transferase
MREVAFALSIGGFTFLITVIWGGPLIDVLRRLGIGKQIRIEIAGMHQQKMGTPTMGGLLIILPVLIVTLGLNVVNLLVVNITGRSILVPLAVLILYGGLGALDDWEGIQGTHARGLGLSARLKLTGQIAAAVVTALVLYFGLDVHSVAIPTIPLRFDMGLMYIPIAVFVMVSTSNAVNLTDGLDGLAGIITASAFAAYGIIALLQGQVYLVQFCFTLVGACFAFLWYNAHPAQLFMGDTGSLALGATLGVVALMTGQWLILPVIAIVPVAETMSVLLQVASSQLSRRLLGRDLRLFRLTPLHHHFEQLGWSETQVVQRFWLVEILASIIGVALALL